MNLLLTHQHYGHYTISYDEITSDSTKGKKGTIVFKRGTASGDAPKLVFNTSMSSPVKELGWT